MQRTSSNHTSPNSMRGEFRRLTVPARLGRAIATVAWATLPLAVPLVEREAIAQPSNVLSQSDSSHS